MFPLILVLCAVAVLAVYLAVTVDHLKGETKRLELRLEDMSESRELLFAGMQDRLIKQAQDHRAEIARMTEKVAVVQFPEPAPVFPPPPPVSIPADFALKMASIMAQVVKDALNPTDNSEPGDDTRRNVTQMASMTPLDYPDDTDPNEWLVDPAFLRDDIAVLGPDEDEPWGIPGLKLPPEVMNPGGQWS